MVNIKFQSPNNSLKSLFLHAVCHACICTVSFLQLDNQMEQPLNCHTDISQSQETSFPLYYGMKAREMPLFSKMGVTVFY